MTQTPPGWYPDPQSADRPLLRYWDGTAWTPAMAPMPVVPAPPVTPDGQVLSGWWLRVLAYLIDSLVIALIGTPFTLPLILSLVREMLDRVNQAMQQAGQTGAAPPVFIGYTAHEWLQISLVSLIQMIIIITYNVVLLRWQSATVGKLVVGLRVRLRDTPGRLPWRTVWSRVLLQWSYGILAIIPLAGSIASFFPLVDDLWPLWDDKKQALHDKVARTNVVRHNQWVYGRQPTGPVSS